MKNKERTRDWSLITYLPEETFLPILENNIQKYAYILHDKDGTTPHWHIVTHTTNPRARDGIKGLFPTEQTTLIERIKVSRKKVFEYLTHKNEKDKHQYTDEEVKTNDVDFWEKEEAESKSTDSLIDDIITGLPFRELARRYGRDYIKNYTAYNHFAAMVAAQEQKGWTYDYQEIQKNIDKNKEFEEFRQKHIND